MLEKAQKLALDFSAQLGAVGVLAVEVSVKDDDISVVSVNLHPDSSGNWTVDGSVTNQYEQHLRAILNLPLGNTSSKVGGVMVNLVGEEGHTGQVVYENIEKIIAIDGVTPHIYGKRETRPFRKMGHVTIVNPNMEEARKVAEVVKNTIKVISQNKS